MDSINLREEFEQMLDSFGHFILLQHTSRKLRCRCWNEQLREGDSNCPYCFGRGRVSRIERHKVRYNSAVSEMTRPVLTSLSPVGDIWTDAKAVYFKYDVNVQSGDYVYEVGWSQNNPHKPVQLIATYVINDVYEYRGDNGRIEYKFASVRRESTNMDIQGIVIRSLGPIENYEIMERR